jgi:hypothetical protein
VRQDHQDRKEGKVLKVLRDLLRIEDLRIISKYSRMLLTQQRKYRGLNLSGIRSIQKYLKNKVLSLNPHFLVTPLDLSPKKLKKPYLK